MAQLTRRGFKGPGMGRATYVALPREYRGTSVQVCGLWPFATGVGAPTVGTPLGKGLRGQAATVCFDEVSWFERAHLIPNPSSFTLGLPALGKSTLTRRRVIGATAQGVIPIVAGDLKPDYVDVIGQPAPDGLGGQVIPLGRGHGSINVLEVGQLDGVADRIGGVVGESLRKEAHGRRLNALKALVTIVRHRPPADYEDTILSAALRVLAARWRRRKRVPVLRDLIALIEEAPDEVRAVALDRGDRDRYNTRVDELLLSLMAINDGALGEMFARPTSVRLDPSKPAICIDLSSISANDTALAAAALMVCWSETFAAVEARNALADAGLEPQRHWLIIMDELWRALREGHGMVNRVDEVTRLNRNFGVGQAMITHSLADLRALGNAADIEKARGFVERSGAVLVGGLPPHELEDLASVVAFSQAEKDLVTSWSTPPGWSPNAEPPGRGNFLLKVGQLPGIPFHVDLTDAELTGFNNTNRRWAAA